MVKDQKQGWVLFTAMFVLWLSVAGLAIGMETHGNPVLTKRGVNQAATSTQSGGNMEGKDIRFDPATCGLYASSTTGTSNGAIICQHDSFTPLGGMAPLVNMMLGEVDPGGVGAGLYGMLIFVLLAVFIAGLMVGRTPEYLGKKIQAAEMKLVVIYILAVPLVVLGFAAASVLIPSAKSSILNPGPHGLTEVVYAFTSAGNNNGSAFGGLNGATELVQHHARPGHARRALRADGPRPGHRRVAGPQAAGAPVGGHVPDGHAAVHRPAGRRRGHRGRPHLLPRPRARSHRRAPEPVEEREMTATVNVNGADQPDPSQGSDAHAAGDHDGKKEKKKLFDRAIMRRAVVDSFTKLDPRLMAKNPVMMVVEVGSVLTTILFFRDLGSSTASENLFAGLVSAWLWFTVLFANFAEAMAEGRGKAQADSLRKARADTIANVQRAGGVVEQVPSPQLQVGDECIVVAGELDPRRRRDHRGHRLGRRVGHHRRVGTGHPRVRRRPLGRHRRHPRAVGPHRRAHHGQAGRDLPRPHDLAGRGGQPAEDAERDRPQHPAVGADASSSCWPR